jgi:hypothetical protein
VAAFTDGLCAERVFWRSLTLRTMPTSFMPHAVEVARHTLMAGPFGAVPALVGRAVGFFQYGSMLRRARELSRAAAEWSDEFDAGHAGGMPGAMTVRIDGPHAGLSRPRGGDHESAPLRRSA